MTNPYDAPQTTSPKKNPKPVIRLWTITLGIALQLFCLDRYFTYESLVKMDFVSQNGTALTLKDKEGKLWTIQVKNQWGLPGIPVTIQERHGSWSHVIWTRHVLGDKAPQDLLDHAVIAIETTYLNWLNDR
jgi:hypothetical protein